MTATTTSLAICLLLLAGCSTTPSQDSQLRAIGIQTFGTDANLKVHDIFYGGPGENMSDEFDASTDVGAIASHMKAAKSQKIDLVVSSKSSHLAAATVLAALRSPSLRSGLQQLRLLFVGTPEDAARIKPVVEATGAKFYFHAK